MTSKKTSFISIKYQVEFLLPVLFAISVNLFVIFIFVFYMNNRSIAN